MNSRYKRGLSGDRVKQERKIITARKDIIFLPFETLVFSSKDPGCSLLKKKSENKAMVHHPANIITRIIT
jgi:hypothetical protein